MRFMAAGGEGTGSHGRVDLMLTYRHRNIPQISTVIAVTNRPLSALFVPGTAILQYRNLPALPPKYEFLHGSRS